MGRPAHNHRFPPPSCLLPFSVVTAAASALYFSYYMRYLASKPALSYVRTKANEEILRRCPSLRRTFYPTPYLTSAHAQTIGSLVRGFGVYPILKLRRETLEAPDGGTIALDWLGHPESGDDSLSGDTPTVIVLHGLTGGTCEPAVRWLLKMAKDNQWRAVLLNSRGCSGAPLTSPQPYTAGYTGDLTLAVAALQKALPNSPLLAVGVSLGASILTKFVAEAADTPQGSGLVAAVSVSNPMDLMQTALDAPSPDLDPKLLWPYIVALSIRMHHYLWRHWHALKEHPALEGVTFTSLLPYMQNMMHVEEKLICPLFGFESREEYYRNASSIHRIPHIRTPMLFYASADDPFIRRHPEKECASNPYTICALTKHGGHCAFMDGILPVGHTRMTKTVREYFEATLHLHRQARASGQNPTYAINNDKPTVLEDEKRGNFPILAKM